MVRDVPRRPPIRSKQAAEYLGITERHLRHLCDRRVVTFHKVGGLRMFNPDDLDRFLDSVRVEPTRGRQS